MFRIRWSTSKLSILIIISLILISLHGSTLFFAFAEQSENDFFPIDKEKCIFVDQTNTGGPWIGSQDNPLLKISDALRIASPFDTIFINQGVYNETLHLNIPIRLIGLDHPVIDGGYSDTIIRIESSDVHIENLRIIHSNGENNDAGLFINQVSNSSIVNCIIHHTKSAIYINDSNQVLIENSSIFHSGNAIRIQNSSFISINSCDFARNSIVLLMEESTQLFINDSVFTANGLSGSISTSSNIHMHRSNITDNSVNKGGLFFTDSVDIFVYDNLFRHNGVGISFSNVTRAQISYCEFIKNTHFAISFRKASYQVSVSNSIIDGNIRNGIYIESGNNCVITNTSITHNDLYAITSTASSMCDARNNYWGQSFGPLYSFFSKSNKLTFLRSRIVFYPWLKQPFEDIGTRFFIPSLRHNHTFDEPIMINFEGLDSDEDGIPDWWEEKYGYSPIEKDDHLFLDPDGDGLNNVQECYTDAYGSNPFFKDVFLEIDWMYCDQGASNKPEEDWFNLLIESYSEQGITLHIDLGNLDGGEEIHYQCGHIPTYAALEDIYWTFFLDNDLQNPRKNIFHYGLLCNFCPDLNFPFVGWNSLDSFAISVEWLVQSYPLHSREDIITGGIAHHLGHTLGLIADTFPGIDNVDTLLPLSESWKNYFSYKSCMNYMYKYRVLTFSDGSNGEGDFNDWDHLDLNFFQQGTYEEI